jgi:hypothetical protein
MVAIEDLVFSIVHSDCTYKYISQTLLILQPVFDKFVERVVIIEPWFFEE